MNESLWINDHGVPKTIVLVQDSVDTQEIFKPNPTHYLLIQSTLISLQAARYYY